MHDLLQVIGDIEFQLGIKSIEDDKYGVAASHFKLGTSHQHAGATFNLGICYELGLGVEQNLKMALDCYIAASSLGHPKAIYNVGVFHAHGLGGLPKNRKLAKQFLVTAAKLGQEDARKALGMRTYLKPIPENPHYTKKYVPQSVIFKKAAAVA